MARAPQALARLRERERTRQLPMYASSARRSESLKATPVREVLMALKAGPAIMLAAREDTQLGEMLLGDWLRPPDSRPDHRDHEMMLTMGPGAVSTRTAAAVMERLRDLVRWGDSQVGRAAPCSRGLSRCMAAVQGPRIEGWISSGE